MAIPIGYFFQTIFNWFQYSFPIFTFNNWRSHITFSIYLIWNINWKRFWNPYGVFSKVAQMPFWIWPPTSHSISIFEEVMLSPLMKILEWLEVPGLKIFQMEFKSFSNPFSFLWWKKSYYLHSRVCFEFKFWIPWNQKQEWKFGKVLLFPLI